MNLQFHNWSLSLDLIGGRIQELSHEGVNVFGTYARMNGKMGNTHLCVPSFDIEGQEKYNLPFHGLVRTIPWTVKNASDSSIVISYITTPSNTYSAELSIEQTFTLKETFVHSIQVAHLRGEAVPLNIGVHYYWDTPQGWDKLSVNSQQSTEGIKSNGYMILKEKNIIEFPHASYEMKSDGFHSAALWTSFKTDESGKKSYSRDFCCIEPVIGWPGYFGSEESMMRKGEQKTVSIALEKLCAGERT